MTEYFNKIADEVQLVADELQSLVFGGFASESGTAETNNFDASGDSGSHAHEFDLTGMDLDGMSEQEVQQLLAEELMQNNPLQGIAEGVTKNILAGQAQPENIMEHLQAFRSAINWSEKFVLGLIAFQIVMFFLCFYVSRKDLGVAPRLTLLVVIGVIVRSSEWLNAKGEQHWESFATQDYFDKGGIFTIIMLSGPLLLDSLMMLLFFMREAAVLLVQVKRTEIQRKSQKQSGKGNGGGKKKNAGKRPKTKKQD